MPYTPTQSEVLEAATAAVAVFKRHKLVCCLVGGLACSLHGNVRTPNDVDLLVMTTIEQERLKEMLVKADGRFYTMAAKTPGATYRVLWYRLMGYHRACKIDLLVPGVMDLPNIPMEYIRNLKGLPVAPLRAILLSKLKAWDDHRNADRAFMREKQYTDIQDITYLLTRANNLRLSSFRQNWISKEYLRQSQDRAKSYRVITGREIKQLQVEEKIHVRYPLGVSVRAGLMMVPGEK